jgi:DMSO/TMAO reductase YedYZ molybdopterin-dependent catalytic subunit
MIGRRLTLSPGVVAGLSATVLATFLSAIVHTVLPTFAFPPLSIGQILVRSTPGWFNSFFIGILGHLALWLAVVGVAVVFAASGALLGRMVESLGRVARSRIAWGALLLPPWTAGVILYPDVPQYLSRTGFALSTLPLLVASGAAGGLIYRRLISFHEASTLDATQDHKEPAATRSPVRTQPRWPGDPALSRRYFLVSLGIGGAGIALGLANLRSVRNPGEQLLRGGDIARVKLPPAAPGDAVFESLPGLTPEVTAIGKHYVVDEEIIDPIIDPSEWRLSIGGLVPSPMALTYRELKELPAIERYQTLECVSNEVGGHLISTAKWVGVELKTVLERARVDTASAVEVVFRASGGYSDSLPFDHAMDESTLVAFGMNDHVLPREHGFPARLLSIGTYGYKNPKWLTGIEVVDRPYTGFWQRRGWAKEGHVKTMSRIDVPRRGRVGDPVTIAGIAFAADRGISRVEVSSDGGQTWSEARLKTAVSPSCWRLWLYEWEPSDGDHELVVRAYDGSGAAQISRPASPFPSGSSGYDAVEVST